MAGEVFIRGDQPWCFMPATIFSARRETVFLSSLKARTLITGLNGLVLTSTTGAKLVLICNARISPGHQLALFNGELFIRAPFNRRRQRHIAGE